MIQPWNSGQEYTMSYNLDHDIHHIGYNQPGSLEITKIEFYEEDTGWAHNFMGVANANIAKINGVAKANIKSVNEVE